MSASLPITPLTLFLIFLKAGGLTPGDGYATLSPLRKALVKQHAWMSEDDFAQSLTLVQAMPGIFSLNLATYLGHRLHGWRGSVAALCGMTLPPLVILLIFASFFEDFRQLPGIEGFLRGARPAIVALVALPCFQLWRQWQVGLSTVWIPIGVALGVGLLGVSPVLIVSVFVGLVLLYGIIMQSNH